MPIPSDLTHLTPQERQEYGFARVRDIAFDAVQELWQRRRAEGVTQSDLATALDRDTGWVSRNLRGPGNWTFRTFGALLEALGGEPQIKVRAIEDPLPRTNYHAYVGYEREIAMTDIQSAPLSPGPVTSPQPSVTLLAA
jgi:transcriptional regulator with XRE-family HTH domain